MIIKIKSFLFKLFKFNINNDNVENNVKVEDKDLKIDIKKEEDEIKKDEKKDEKKEEKKDEKKDEKKEEKKEEKIDDDSNNNDDSATCSFEYLPIFVSSISEFIGIALGTCVIDRLGRVNSQFIFYSVTGISVLICAFDLSRYTLLILTFISYHGLL